MSNVKSSTFLAALVVDEKDPESSFLTDLKFLKDDPRYKKFYTEENGDPVIFTAYIEETKFNRMVSFINDSTRDFYNLILNNKKFNVELGYAEIPKPIAHRATFHGSGVAQPSSWVDGPGPWPEEINGIYKDVTYEYAYPPGDGRDDIIAYKVGYKYVGNDGYFRICEIDEIPDFLEWKDYKENYSFDFSDGKFSYAYALKKKKIEAKESDEPSNTTKALQELLASRDAMGRKKYGASLDRTDLTATDWLNHMLEELLDGAGYAMRAIEGIKRIESKLKKIEKLLEDKEIGVDDEY